MATEHHDRSIAAEARGVEENHHAYLLRDKDGPYIRVNSDTVAGRWYRITAHVTTAGADVLWTCKPNDLHRPGRRRDHGLKCSTGETGCKHMTRAARRLERAELVRWVDPHVDQGIAYAGRWVGARPSSPVLFDDLAPAEAASDLPAEALAEIDTWLNVPAVTAASLGVRSPWVVAMTTLRISPAERTEVRRIPGDRLATAAECRRNAAEAPRVATDAPGYREAMRTLDPFAAFAGSDQRG